MTGRLASAFLAGALLCVPVAASAQDVTAGESAAATGSEAEGDLQAVLARAMTAACLPAITGMIDTGNADAMAGSFSKIGLVSVERADPLLRMMAPKGSSAIYFGQDTDQGRVSLAVAQDRPFCTLAMTGIASSSDAAEGVARHFAGEGVPFEKSGDRTIANGQMTSADYDWQVDPARSIGARVMRPLVSLPQGKDFILITMFVSSTDITEN